jgi:hypothetical protein
MKACSQCGAGYSFWNATGSGLCPRCQKDKAKADEEARLARIREAQVRNQEKSDRILPGILEKWAPGEKAHVLAAVCWVDAGSALGTLRDKALMGALLGGLGMKAVASRVSFGIAALTAGELLLIDLGTEFANQLTLEKFEAAPKAAKVLRYKVDKLKVEFDRESAVLSFRGRPNIALVFTPALGIKNPDIGASVAKVLGSERTEDPEGDPLISVRECPHCQTPYDIKDYRADARMWKCSACLEDLPKERLQKPEA